MKPLASFCYDKRWFVLIGWIIFLVGIVAASSALQGEYKTEFKLPGSESQAALDLLKSRGMSDRTGFSGQIVFHADQGVNDPQVRQTLEKLFSDIQTQVPNIGVVSPYDAAHAYQISKDGKIGYAEMNFADRDREAYVRDADTIKDLRSNVHLDGLEVDLGGDIFASQPAFSSEGIGVAAAVIILLIAFGSVLAMGLPIATALCGIGAGFALIGLLTRVMAVPEFTSQVAAMIGIGVGIDYALLIVTRYRSALQDGLAPRDAVILSLNTSGRAVVFAGLTVVISLLGMWMMDLDFIRAVSIAAVLAVVMTMLAAITLLPALLGFVGRNIDKLGLPHRHAAEGQQDIRRSFWYRWSRVIQAHPWPAFLLSGTLLIVLAIPVLSLRLGFSDAGNRSTGDTTRASYDLLSQGFGPGFNGPMLLVADMPNGAQDLPAVQKLVTQLQSTEGVASVTPPQFNPSSNLALVNVYPTTAPQDKATTDTVHRIRHDVVPVAMAGSNVHVYTTGLPPVIIDFSDYMAARLPLFFGAVLALSFLLLLAVFHSVVVPLKAVIMNMLSIGASFGAMVAVFQWGIGGSLLGLGKEGPIEAWAPMMLFAIVFGLSMDYEVFLLTRVREEYDRGHNNSAAVADGLAATGRVISAAAAIMVCVFASFILIDERPVKLLGFGLAIAVLIDATIVRLILVPSTMELLGDRNWWAPAWLVRFLPRIKVDTVDEPVAVAGGGGGGGGG